MPFAYWTFLAGTLAIAGVPPFSGFFSKDSILDQAAALGHPWLFAVGVAAAALTAFYMFRLFFSTFSGEYRGAVEPHIDRVPTMDIPVGILAVLATISGFLVLPGRDRFSAALAGAFPDAIRPLSLEQFDWPLVFGTLMIVAACIVVAYAMYVISPQLRADLSRRVGGLRALLLDAYHVDAIYHAVFEVPTYALARACGIVFERVVIAGVPHAIAAATGALGGLSRAWETGYLRRYGLTIAIGASLLLYFVIFGIHGGDATGTGH